MSQNLNDLVARVALLEEQVKELQAKLAEASKPRDRGPASERPMTEVDAWLVMHGAMKDVKHKDAASQLGISYGQVYSARGGYTFKQVKKDWIENATNKAALEKFLAERSKPAEAEAQQ